MAKFWRRLHKVIHAHERDRHNEATGTRSDAERQTAPQQRDYALAQQQHDSISLRHALAPSSRVARSDQNAGSVETHQSRSILRGSRGSSILLSSPEYRHARARQEYLDAAVPKELQRSKVSCDLHDLTISDEAGQRPYCEDVAERNLCKSKVRSASVPKRCVALQPNPYVHRNPAHQDCRPPCAYLIRTAPSSEGDPRKKGTRFANQYLQERPDVYTNLGIPNRPERRSKSLNEQSTGYDWQPLVKEERRHSLTHKPNIFDLRNTFELGAFQSQGAWPPQCRLGSHSSRRSSIKRSRLERPLPAVPVRASGERSDLGFERQIPHLTERDRFLISVNQPASLPPSLGRSEDTSVRERWAPCVTHETIIHNRHEVREEHIHKEIHEYHVNHRIQPVIEYEILPPRHFVVEGEGFREIDESEIPPGTPNAEWYADEVAANLESMVQNRRNPDGGQSLTPGTVLVDTGSSVQEHAYRG